MIRVVIADDHHLVRQGIRLLLERAHDIQVVGEAPDGDTAIELVARLRPDVLLIDLAMPRLNGIEAVEQVTGSYPETRIVVLSMHIDEALVRQALRAGAKGYVAKDSAIEELLHAVRAANYGATYLSQSVSGRFWAESAEAAAAQAESNPVERLTRREREVLTLVAEGHTNTEIATHLNVSVKTVEKHRASLMKKLDVHDLAGLIRLAIKYGLVSLDE